MSFDREYRSKWAGTLEDAFFSSEMFDRNRILKQPEYEHSGRSGATAFYIISADIGRKGDNTCVCVFKVSPQQAGTYMKTLVNIYSVANEHFEDQAIMLKRIYYKYKAKRLIIDGNGLVTQLM